MKFADRGHFYAVAAIFSLALAACSGGGGTAEIVVDPTETPCGPTQKMEGYEVAWLFYQCNETDSVIITDATEDPRTGLPLGDLPPNRGMLSLRYHWLDNADFSEDAVFGIYFEDNGPEANWESNWQFLGSWYPPGNFLFTYLKVQRFDQSNCSDKCQNIVDTDKVQFTNPADIYQWDCEWNAESTARTNLSCTVTKVGDPTFKVTMQNNTFGPYLHLNMLRMGRNTSKTHLYGSFQGSVSDVKFTVFN